MPKEKMSKSMERRIKVMKADDGCVQCPGELMTVFEMYDYPFRVCVEPTCPNFGLLALSMGEMIRRKQCKK